MKKEKIKKEKIKKEKKPNKFIETIKKKWLIDGTKTFLLVLIIIAIFIAITMIMHNLELTPLDFSQEKLYTLTDESKEKVKNIDKDVNIYFIGSTDEDANLTLAKQYKNVPAFEMSFDYEVEDDEEEEVKTKIVKRKNIDTKPMSEEEAELQMQLLNHDFFVFKNIDEECVSVLYTRKDGTLGIINVK